MIEKLCYLEDNVLKQPGLYTLWTILYLLNFVCLLSDETTGAVRNFNVLSNGLSVLYVGGTAVNNIYGNQKPSTLLLSVGPVHQYAHWLLFAYFGGSDVLSSSPVGTMNWIGCFVVGLFTIDMVIKTWYITFNTQEYLDYVKPQVEQVQEQNNGVELTTVG